MRSERLRRSVGRAMQTGAIILSTVGAMFLTACSHQGPTRTADATTPPAHAPTTAPMASDTQSNKSGGGTYSVSKFPASVDWPTGWTRKESNDYDLLVLQNGDESKGQCSFDVPDLPPHIPGMIPIGSVRGGYVDDLKKNFGTVDSADSADLGKSPVPDAKQRFVRSTWTKDGTSMQETALLLVHGDHVLILRGRSPTSTESATRPALDAMIKSLRWSAK